MNPSCRGWSGNWVYDIRSLTVQRIFCHWNSDGSCLIANIVWLWAYCSWAYSNSFRCTETSACQVEWIGPSLSCRAIYSAWNRYHVCLALAICSRVPRDRLATESNEWVGRWGAHRVDDITRFAGWVVLCEVGECCGARRPHLKSFVTLGGTWGNRDCCGFCGARWWLNSKVECEASITMVFVISGVKRIAFSILNIVPDFVRTIICCLWCWPSYCCSLGIQLDEVWFCNFHTILIDIHNVDNCCAVNFSDWWLLSNVLSWIQSLSEGRRACWGCDLIWTCEVTFYYRGDTLTVTSSDTATGAATTNAIAIITLCSW